MRRRVFAAGVIVLLGGAALAAGFARPAARAGARAGAGANKDTLRASTDLIQDGGFETPVVPAGGYLSFTQGQSFDGWRVVGANGDVAIVSASYKSGSEPSLSFPAASGSQWLDLTGYLSNQATGVSQTVATTPGARYELNFWVGNVNDPKGIFGTSSTVDVFVNGSQVMTATNSGGAGTNRQVWQKFTQTFTATSASTSIEFRNGDPPSDNSNGLDDVSLTQNGPTTGCGTAKGRMLQGGVAINEVRVVSVTPEVSFHRQGDTKWCPLEKDTVLKQGDEISCDPDGSVVLSFEDNSTVTVRNTTQLKIGSFFTEGGVVRTEILLKMGEVAAKVNKAEGTKSDFHIKTPAYDAGVNGTRFSVFADPLDKAGVVSVQEGVVSVDPTKPGLPTTSVPAGKEVEVTATALSPLAPLGKAGARGGVTRVKAHDLVLKVVARNNGPCNLTTPRTGAFSVKPSATGWLVSVKATGGKAKGWSMWQVTGAKVTPSNAAAKKIAAGCR